MVFGLIFAAFANIGKTYLVFICNAVSRADFVDSKTFANT